MTTDSAHLLQKHLQKSFRCLESCVNKWETTLTECDVVVASTANLCEQYVSCKQVDVQCLPMAKMFPDVQERLLYKIMSEIDIKLKTLQEKLKLLKEAQDQFSKSGEQCMKLYTKHHKELDVYKMTESNTTWPSLAEMLEMLVDADSRLSDLYYCKIHWLEQFPSETSWDCDALCGLWSTHDKEIVQTLKDHLCHVSFFLQEKL